MLSGIERGQFPKLPTLVIALVFGVDPAHFFQQRGPENRRNARERGRTLANPGTPGSYVFEIGGPPPRGVEVSVSPGPASEPHQHGTEEFVYMLKGTLAAVVEVSDRMQRGSRYLLSALEGATLIRSRLDLMPAEML